MTITIRPLTEDDIDQADAIVVAAFDARASRKPELRRYLTLQPDGWLLALLDGKPAGVVGAVDYGPFAYIGMMTVLPEMQRRGIGLALMERLLAWLDRRGCPIALLDATPAGEPLYARLGFVEDARVRIFRPDDCAPPPRLSERIAPLHERDIPALVEFDTPIFGARRTMVFASFLADYPDRAFVARDTSGQISGYLFAQRQLIGPWVALDPASAEALLAAALPLPYEDGPGIQVPGPNEAATGLLLRYGFSPQRSLAHMRRGGAGAPGRRALLYGQASFAIG